MTTNNQPNHERFHWWNEVQSQLGEPFPAEQVQWKPQKTWNPDNWDDGNKRNHTQALAVAYIDARVVADRLDTVLSPGGWQLEHRQEGGQLLTGLGGCFPILFFQANQPPS